MSVRPNSERKDLDPFELMSEVLANPSLQPYLPTGIELPDLLTQDIELKLVRDGERVWFTDGWQARIKEEVKRLSIDFKIDKERYEFWVGHHSWIQEIWAVPVELRIIKTGEPVPATSSRFCYSMREAMQDYCKEPHKEGSPERQGKPSEDRRVMLVLNRYHDSESTERGLRARLLALYSKADERFAKLCTILSIWKTECYNKVDTERAIPWHAFELMLIHFLQVGCRPPVLPCLQRLNIDLETCKPSDIEPRSRNKKSLANLLFNFFNYYEMKQSGGIDFENWKISVREGCLIRLDKKSRGFWIEDPVGKGSRNVVDESKCPGMSHILTYMFTQIRIRLMKDRRLSQLDDSLAT